MDCWSRGAGASRKRDADAVRFRRTGEGTEVITDINDEQGVTVLFVEQNVAAAMAVPDRHYILDEGRIVAEATTGQLRDDDDLRQTYLGV